jgi:protein AaeX
MLKEVNIDGIFVAPFALDLAIAFVIFLPLRMVLDRYAIQRWVWHRQLFDLAIFVILVSLIGFAVG